MGLEIKITLYVVMRVCWPPEKQVLGIPLVTQNSILNMPTSFHFKHLSVKENDHLALVLRKLKPSVGVADRDAI